MNFPKPPQALDRDLLFDFFWTFSVFECALKRGSLLIEEKKYAEANWDKFANKISCKFSEIIDPEFCGAVDRIKSLSPERQMNDRNKLKWEAVIRASKDSDASYTLKLLKVVRNNLFHGGKYPGGGPPSQIARDGEILRAALIVLRGCYELDPDIKRFIDEVAA